MLNGNSTFEVYLYFALPQLINVGVKKNLNKFVKKKTKTII